MVILKKLLFAPFFIISFALLVHTFNPILKSYDFIFSLSLSTLIQLITLASFFCLTSFLFVIFATISMDWKVVIPVGILAALLPMVFLNPAQGLVLSVGSLVAFTITFAILENKLKSYLTFETAALFGPSIRSLISFLVLVCAFIYFLSANQLIQQSGFEIPDSLLDTVLQFTQPKTDEQESASSQFSLPKEQLDLLKKNPELLRQSGLDPSILDSLGKPQKGLKTPQDLSNSLIKTAVKDQIQGFIKPYMTFIPAVLAVLFFFTVQSITAFISLLIYPLLWIIFIVLEKSGFIQFTTEMRPVKKMVV